MRQLLLLLFAFAVSFAVDGQKLSPNSRIIYFGDSQTSFSYNSSGNSVQFQNYGYVSWVTALSPSVSMPKGGILAIPGETTSQMVNRLDGITNFDAKIMVVLAGTNDPLYGIGPETTKSNLRRIYNAGLAAGMKVIAITILPRFAQNTYSPAVEANRLSINAWMKSQTDIFVVDAENDLNGPEYFEDGLHTSPAGAYVLGKKVAGVVNSLVYECVPGSASAAQLSVASNSNPLMTGTNGRLSTASGTVATHWQLAGNFAGTASVMGSKEVGENGREKQVITISGNYTGNTRKVTFNNYASSPIALSSGQVVEGIAEIELPSDLINIKSIYLKLQAYAPEYASTLAEAYSMFPTSNKPLVMERGKYVLRTPPMTIDPGTVGELVTQIVIEFNSTSTTDPVALTMKVSSIGIRQLPLTVGPVAAITPAGTTTLCPGDSLLLKASSGSGYTYQWHLDGSPVRDSIRSGFTASQPGSYSVAVNIPGCTLLSDPTVLSADHCVVHAISTDSVRQQLCAAGALSVPFRTSGTFASDNIFAAQLSDANGSFDNAVVIGTLADTTGGMIAARLPANVAPGTKYRIRVVSSNPVVVGTDGGHDITINAKPLARIEPADSVSTTAGRPAVLTAYPQGSYTYRWLLNGAVLEQDATGQHYSATAAGTYRVVVQSQQGCADTSAATVVRVEPCHEIIVNIINQNDSVVTVEASGGVRPYYYSVDSVQYQADSTFVNLKTGRDYTIYVRDSVGCTEELSFTLRSTADIESTQGAGNKSITLARQRLGDKPGLVVITYDMLNHPDQMDITYNNQLVASTNGYVTGKGWLWFAYDPATDSTQSCYIRVHAQTDEEPEWTYTTLRPIGSYLPMKAGKDTVSSTVFVSPNFPNAYPADTVMVHTLTPVSKGCKLHVDFKALLLNGGVLSVYDGADTSAHLLAKFSGLYGQEEIPAIMATNPKGQLTFKFVTGQTAGHFGWISNVYCQSVIQTFYPQVAKSSDTVVISGNGFVNVTSVRFGKVDALSYQVLSDTCIKAVVASGKSGDVEVIALGKPALAEGFVFNSEVVSCSGSTQVLTSAVQGVNYRWQISTDSLHFKDIADEGYYVGTQSSTLQIQNMPSSFYGYQFRCVVDGAADDTHTLKIVNTWVGGNGSDWETAANWSCGAVPDQNMDVVITKGAEVVINANTTVRSLRLQQDAVLTVVPGILLQVRKH